MKSTLWGALAVLLLASCASTPPPTPAATPTPEPQVETPVAPTADPVVVNDRVEVTQTGFSPLAQSPANTLAVALRWGNQNLDQAWKLQFVDADGTPLRTMTGNPTQPTVTWDGRADDGTLVPAGNFAAVLMRSADSVNWSESARSKAFLVDIHPPTGTLVLDPQPYVPGSGDLHIRVNAVAGDATVASWRLGVLYEDGRRFRDFIDEEYQDNLVTWNGRATNNALLDPAVVYHFEAEIFDIYGNRGLIRAELPLEAPPPVSTLKVTLDGKLLAAWPVYFAPFSADLSAVGGERVQANSEAMDHLVELLKAHPDTAITIVGHANQVFYDDPVRGPVEQKTTLIPLSEDRAKAVEKALAQRGIDTTQFLLKGVGALDPEVSFADAINRWKNRRVVVELTNP